MQDRGAEFSRAATRAALISVGAARLNEFRAPRGATPHAARPHLPREPAGSGLGRPAVRFAASGLRLRVHRGGERAVPRLAALHDAALRPGPELAKLRDARLADRRAGAGADRDGGGRRRARPAAGPGRGAPGWAPGRAGGAPRAGRGQGPRRPGDGGRRDRAPLSRRRGDRDADGCAVHAAVPVRPVPARRLAGTRGHPGRAGDPRRHRRVASGRGAPRPAHRRGRAGGRTAGSGACRGPGRGAGDRRRRGARRAAGGRARRAGQPAAGGGRAVRLGRRHRALPAAGRA